MFRGSRNMLITGGEFVTNMHCQEGQGIKLLEKHVASGAFHDSAERHDSPRCYPGTCEAIINEIMDWIQTIDKEEFILWLYGPAGAGKSAIAQTIAELCSRMELLAAGFFFSRTVDSRNDTTRLIPTIAYQLAISIPEILKHICFVIEKDPLIFTRSLETQLEALIFQPLAALPLHQNLPGETSKSRPRLIIIDGLDECREVRSQRYILTTLSSCLRRYSAPLIFLITSRPEPGIRDTFNEVKMTLMTRRLVLDGIYKPDVAILASKFRHAVPLLRAYQPRYINHLYTTDAAELQRFVANLGYKDEGIAGYVFPEQEPHTTPLYRLYHVAAENHFYTTNAAERDDAAANAGYRKEGIAGYVYPDPTYGALPLYRLFHLPATNHFYTMSADERDNASSNSGYTQEGVAGYIPILIPTTNQETQS